MNPPPAALATASIAGREAGAGFSILAVAPFLPVAMKN